MSRFTELELQLGRTLYSALLGNGTPRQLHSSLWMEEIRPGDTVVELSTGTLANEQWAKAIGVLLRVEDEPIVGEDGKPAADGATERYWIVDTDDGEVRWFNARFVRIPVTDHERSLFGGYARRCDVASCDRCARERWSERGQELRR